MEERKNQKDVSKKGLFIGFIIILVGINGYQFYLGDKAKKSIEEKTIVIEEKTNENLKLIASIDSMQNVIKQQQDEYSALGIENSELAELNQKLEEQKKSLQANALYKNKFFQLQKELDNMKSELSESSDEIEKIKADRDQLFAENTKLKEQKNKLADSISRITASSNVMEQKVKVASKLLVWNLKTTVTNKKGKELNEAVYKSKSIHKINIKYNYLDNKVAELGTRVAYLRVIEPDGATMTDANGSGTFFYEGQEINYTAKQDLLFDNSQKTISFPTGKTGGEYKPGKYLIEIYTDGDKSGEGFFMIK